ncbi:SPOR domain-containing protein [Helicobacter sp. MIT 14-3879]|uniref:SPOR domain-containing protein n=1 Tax=Helicobacter sp. MIT 14-3879 TaxID=2040649 RepID=UPI000E1F5640|nr:SPOR domain-containing protein [Helicobacter sp. MIT 14-3879]RDU62288.1 hypothetical protein CQA44_07285 [Helicobacter sp. MIT 14-3879]
MNDKRELNDILIGGEDHKTKESKKLILLIVGIVILVLAISIIVIAMTNTKEDTIVVNHTEKVDGNIPKEFTPINVDNDEDRFEQIVRDIKNNSGSLDNNTTSNNVLQTETINTEPPKKATMPQKIDRASSTIKPIITSTPKRNVNRLNNGDIAENGYYLQVGAFSKTPNKSFINSLNNYSYRIQEIMINSNVITRYLIGPYSSREEAQMDFDRVSREIAKPVFLQVQ